MKKILQLIAIILLSYNFGNSQAPKVVVIGANHNSTAPNTDGISFVVTDPLGPSEVIYFTEDEYESGMNRFNPATAGESVIQYTAPAGGLAVGQVVFLDETGTSTNTFNISCTSGTCGSATVISGPFSLATSGEGIYAYSDIDSDPTNGVTQVYSVLYTISGNIPTSENPITDFPTAVVVDGFTSGTPDRTEYKFSPASERDGVSQTDLENTLNYLNGQTNQALSVVEFTNLNLAGANPALIVTRSPASRVENSGSPITYTFTLSSASMSNVTVNFSVGGTATFSTDYTQSGAATFMASSGTITIFSGNTTANLMITPTADTDLEPDETVIITAVAGTGYDVGSPGSATGTITNDDVMAITPAVAVTGVNNSTTMSPGVEGFSFVALDDITAGTEIYFTEEEFNKNTLAFSTTSGEGVVRWTAPAGGVMRGEVIVASENTPDTFTATCDSGTCGTFTTISTGFAFASDGEGFYAYSDGDADPTNGITQVHSVLYTGASGSPGGNIPAMEDPSMVYTGAVVVDGFPAIEPLRTEYRHPAERNTTVDQADFQNTSNWFHAQSPATLSTVPFTNIIIATGSPNPALTVAVSPSSVVEDSGTDLVFTFTLSAMASSDITVKFDVAGTADFSTDYTTSGAASFTASEGTAIIPMGMTTVDVTITPVVDAVVEPTETVELMITSGTGYDGGSPNAATGSITNDDTSNSNPLVAITGLSHSTTDGFSFVAAQDISPGTVIYFTDKEFDNTSLMFSSGESVLQWTSPGVLFPKGDVVVVTETSSDVFSLTCSETASIACGTLSVIQPGFALATNGETFYAYADSDTDPTNGVDDIYSVMYTGNSTTSGGNLPATEDPSVIYLQALVVDGFPAVAPDKTEYTPASRAIPVGAADFENPANYDHAFAYGAGLSTVPFAALNIVVTFSAPGDLCVNAGEQTGLGGGLPVGGIYSGPGVTDDENGMTYRFDPSVAGVGTHTILYTESGKTASDEIEVFALPEVTLDDFSAVCLDDGIQTGLSGGMPAGGEYSGTGVTDNNGTFTFDPSAGTSEIFYTFTDGNRCTNSDSKFLTVNDITLMTSSTNATCTASDGTASVSVTGGSGNYSYTWSANAGSQNTPTATDLSFGTYMVTVLDNVTGCIKSTSVDVGQTIIVLDVSFTAPEDLCIEEGFQTGLEGGTPAGGVYSGPGVANEMGGTYSFNPVTAGPGLHTITYTVTDENGCTGSSSGMIRVFPTPEINIEPTVSITEGTGGTTTMEFTVTVSSTDCPSSINYSTANGTAIAGSDYTAANGKITFDVGDPLTKTIDVDINPDAIVEFNENFTVTLSSPLGANLGNNISSIGTIRNDDSSQIMINDVTQNEGSGPMMFTITMSNPVAESVSLFATTADGTATTIDNDYNSTTNLIFIPPGLTSQTFTVTVNNDPNVEMDESFFVNLSSLFSFGLPVSIADNQGEGTIQNDDSATLSIGDVTQNEGSGSMIFTVSLSNPVDGTISVNYATADGTAIAGSDYTAASGTLTFTGGGSQMLTFPVNIINESTVEMDESFFVNLSGLSAAGLSVSIADDQGVGNILNDDAATLSIDDVSQLESSGSMTFTVTLSNAVDGLTTVDFVTADGTATTGDNDYIATNGTLTFTGNAGETQTFMVPVIDDSTVENDETYGVSLFGLNSLLDVSIEDGSGTGTILNDDMSTISINDVSQVEAGGPMTFSVTLTNPVDGGLQVNYGTSDGTAFVANNDYDPASGTLTFAGTGGEVETIVVGVNDDSTVELDETYNVILSGLTSSVSGVSILDGSGLGRVINDDAATINIISDVSMMEGDGGTTPFNFMISLSNDVEIPEADIVVDFNTMDGTATTADNDYMPVAGTVSLPLTAGSTTETVDVNGDITYENDESFTVKITANDMFPLPPGVTIGEDMRTGTIINDDCPVLSMTSPGDFCINDGLQEDLEGGMPDDIGGVYSGDGVTDNEDGKTFDFDPEVAGVGMHTITFTFNDGGICDVMATAVIEVFDLPEVTFNLDKDGFCEDVTSPITGLGGGFPTGGKYSGPGVTDDGNGLTFSYDVSVGGTDSPTVIYSYTDENRCTASASAMLSFFECTPAIVDPCSCLDNATVYDVDAMTGGEDGQFGERVSIIDGQGAGLPAGQTWTVTGASGAYDAFNVPAVGTQSALMANLVGQALMDDGMGGYFIDFVHVDDMAYSITVEGPFTQGDPANVERTIGNRCKYPNPEFDPSVPDDICPTSPVFTFGAIDPEGIGEDDVTYELSYEGGPFMPVVDFNPQVMMPGTYVVKMTYDGSEDGNMGISPDGGTTAVYPGCTQMIQKTMELREPVDFMSCNDLLRASLGEDCTVELIAEMFFEDELFRCYDDYIITVDGVEDPVIREIGEYSVGLYDPVTGNNCWATVIVEDKLGPVFPMSCMEEEPCEVPCYTPESEIIEKLDQLVEMGTTDCSGREITGPSVVRHPAKDCGSPDTLVFTYTGIDGMGNRSVKSYYYTLTRLDISDLDFPGDWDGTCNSSRSPDATGQPRFEEKTVPFGTSAATQMCDILIGFTDLEIPVCGNECDGSEKIVRNWTALDWCTQQLETGVQIIHLKDNEDPEIMPFEPDTVSVDPWTCEIERYRLPAMDVSDNCTSVDKLIQTVVGPAGVVVRQESDGLYYAYNVPKGTHYFQYYAEDCCGNVSLVEPFELTVIDDVAPIAIAKQYTVVSLSNDGDRDGIAKLYAESLDNGSYDRCTDVHLEIRRDGIYSERGRLRDYPVDNRYPCGEVGNDSYNNDGHTWDIPFISEDRSETNRSNDPDGGAYVKFCCSDLDQSVVDANGDGEIDDADMGYMKVWLRVWDNADMSVDTLGNPTYGTAGDHYNDTWGYVKVEVSSPPVLEVEDASIRCDWPYEEKFRERFFSDTRGEWVEKYISYSGICDVRLSVELNDDNIDPACPRGYFELIYTATNRDSKGLETVRVQRVYIDDLEGRMTCADIDWPASYQEVGCMELNTEPELTWHADACELVGWTLRSDTFRFESDACIKVVNEYTVIDWCQWDWYYEGMDETMDVEAGSRDIEPSIGYFEGGHDYFDGLLCRDPREDTSAHLEAPDNGVYKYIEVIKVDDDVPPEIEVRDTMYAITTIECERTIELEATVTDGSDESCPATWFKWEITFDWNENGVFDDYTYTRDRFGAPLRGDVLEFVPYDWTVGYPRSPLVFSGPMLSYDVQYIAYDGCGNVDKEVRNVMIVDKKPPTPYCVSLSSAVMNNGQVELWARDFDKGSFDNCYDDEFLLFTFNEEHPVLADLEEVHYFKGMGEEATIEEYNEGEAQKWDPSERSSARIFDCDDVAVSPVGVRMTVWDPKVLDGEFLNWDWCEVELTLVNNQPDACGEVQQRAMISGHIETDEGENLSEVQVSVQNMKDSAYRLSMMTSNDGNYAFMDNPMYTDYEIQASKSGEDDEGVSTLDIVLIQRHILGLEEFTSPYKVIASDVNGDQRVTGTDLVIIRKLILGIYKSWPEAPVWKFVEKSDLLTVENALKECQEKIAIRELLGNMSDQNFVGVKMGDVNGSARANGRDMLNQARSRGTLSVELEEQEVKEGEEVMLKFSGRGFSEVYGYQFTLELDGLRIESVESGDAGMTESNIGILDDQTVTVSYADMEGLGSSDDLYTLRAIAKKSGRVSEMIALTSKVLNSEGYVGEGLEIHTIELSIEGGEDGVFSLGQNEPNPWDELTVIGFELPEAGQATITVYDVTGKMVANIRGNYSEGYHQIKLTREDLNTRGVLYYTLKSGDYHATRKMIIIE